MSAAVLNLTVEQNASFEGVLTLSDGSTALPSNVSGVVAKMAIVALYGRPPLISLSSPSNGLIVHDSTDHISDPSSVTINLTAAQTTGLAVLPSVTVNPPKATYYYDLILEYPSGWVTRLVQGTIIVIGGATSD
jgi:hypothetical protein